MTDALLAALVALHAVGFVAARIEARLQRLASLSRTPEEYRHLRGGG